MRRPSQPPPRRRATNGLTLVELLVALAVFAILGSLSFRAIDRMSSLELHLASQHAHWRNLEYATHRIESDLLGLALLPLGMAALAAQAQGGEPSLRMLIDDGEPPRLRVVSLRHDGRRLLRSAQGAGPASDEILLEEVEHLAWRFMHRGRWYSIWPPPDGDPSQRPDVVEIRLEVAGIGLLTRLVALR